MSRQFASILKKTAFLDDAQIAAALETAQSSRRPLWEVLLSDYHVDEVRLAEAIARGLQLSYMRLATLNIDPELIKAIPEAVARKHLALPIRKEAEVGTGAARRRPALVVALPDPTDLGVLQDLEFATGCRIQPVVATRTDLSDAITRSYAPEQWLESFLKNVQESDDVRVLDAPVDEVEPSPETAPVVKVVSLIIHDGITQGASDIHIEPTATLVQVRTRIDGLMQEFMQLPKWLQPALISRIKVLANLDITERRAPQDGRIKIAVGQEDVDLRVSTLPTQFGEKIVMRVLGTIRQLPELPRIGLAPADQSKLLHALSQPQGLILVTGPTGSGKTTSLYSMLQHKRDPSLNIITVEDPIEFQLPGLNQVQVNARAGLTFGASVRSILRQDPDVVFVGEIRDLETAEIAFQAALTGHLVLSSLHTNSTIATLVRLMDLGLEAPLISSALNLVVAQRLVRQLCPECRVEATPTPAQRERLGAALSNAPVYRSKGCKNCRHSGYRGRIGVFELLRLTPSFRELVRNRAGEGALRAAAVASGTTFLLQDALNKVYAGLTSLDEVLRVLQVDATELDWAVDPQRAAHQALSGASAAPNLTSGSAQTTAAGGAGAGVSGQQGSSLSCGNCGQTLQSGWRICPVCGTPANLPSTAAIAQVPAQAASAAAASAAPEAKPVPASTPAVPVPPPAPAGLGEPRHEFAELGGRKPRIMVVDDDEVMRCITAKVLEELPFAPEVIEAENGAEALARAEANKPDLILLDVQMPDMSGYEVCQKLRSKVQTAFIPIMMLTASVEEQSRTQGFLVGTDDYMGKPFAVPELHARVLRLLRRTYGI